MLDKNRQTVLKVTDLKEQLIIYIAYKYTRELSKIVKKSNSQL
jgi:hypothetical protein